MLLLFKTPVGFFLFKVLDEGKLSKVEDLSKEFSSADSARQVVKLKAFEFKNTSEDSKPSKGLHKFLRAQCDGETLVVADSKLGNAIKEKLQIECVHNHTVMELMRGVRSQLTELISCLASQNLAPMSLGSHSLSRYELKFSPDDEADTMIIQAVGLLDDLDKELSTYATLVRQWYGRHFPELAKIVQDNILYAKAVKLMQYRSKAAKLDFSQILTDREVEIEELKEAAMISTGTEVSDLDWMIIKDLCDQVLSLAEYRAPLYDNLKNRMNTNAPNLTALVGELVGARLIARAGSMTNLAEQAGSRVQLLGAEKALFRALKTKTATPKYGLLFHASLVRQAAPKHKGKIARSLAAKIVLAIRCDVYGDRQDNSMGLDNRAKLEARLRNLERSSSAGSAKGKPKKEFYDKDRKKGAGAMITAAKVYNPSADSTLGRADSVAEKEEEMEEASQEAPVNREKKEKKKQKETADSEEEEEVVAEPEIEEVGKKEMKKKKKHAAKDDGENAVDEKKKRKRKHAEAKEEETETPSKKQKRKKNKKNKPRDSTTVMLVGWTRPRLGYHKLNTDGAYNIAMGTASTGGILRDHEGRWMGGFHRRIEVDSALKAEIWALRDGLNLAREEHIRKLEIEVDALDVMRLMNINHPGSKKTKKETNHPLSNMISDCRSLMQEFEEISIKHIYREANRCADALANDTPISVGDLYLYHSIPRCITSFYDADLKEVSYPRKL